MEAQSGPHPACRHPADVAALQRNDRLVLGYAGVRARKPGQRSHEPPSRSPLALASDTWARVLLLLGVT